MQGVAIDEIKSSTRRPLLNTSALIGRLYQEGGVWILVLVGTLPVQGITGS